MKRGEKRMDLRETASCILGEGQGVEGRWRMQAFKSRLSFFLCTSGRESV